MELESAVFEVVMLTEEDKNNRVRSSIDTRGYTLAKV